MKKVQNFLIAATLLILTSCGVIPESYRGDFEDASAGIKVTLEANKGKMQFSDGQILESDASDLTFEQLLAGKAGIYVSKNPTNENLLDVFWIRPNLASRQESAGLVWYQSEVLYGLMDASRKDPVISVALVHCVDGGVMLDGPTQNWQVGCPAAPKNYQLSRVSKKPSGQAQERVVQSFQELPQHNLHVIEHEEKSVFEDQNF